MNTSDQQIIWKYIDGDCSPEEIREVEQKMATDPAFKAELEERKKLQQAFQAMETEEPSLRFAANVMDNLPEIYQRTAIPPLVRPFWTRAFLVSLVGAFLVLLVVFMLSPGAIANPDSFWGLQEAQQLGSWVNSLPAQLLVLISSLSFGSLLLIWIDRQPRHRFKGS